MKAAILLALLGSACTFESGRGFATLEAVELHAHFEPGADGGVLTDLGYDVRLEAIHVELHALELASGEHEAEPATEDEHEHCHDVCPDDEGEPPEAHAEEGEPAAVATLAIERSVDALAGEELFLTEVAPSRELPEAHLERAELGVGRVELVGSVVYAEPGTEIPLAISVDLGTHVASELDVAISHEGPEQITLYAELSLEATLFDGVDFAASESFEVDDEDERAEALRSALAAALHLHVAAEGLP